AVRRVGARQPLDYQTPQRRGVQPEHRRRDEQARNHQIRRRFRITPKMPSSPVPSSRMEPGSGVADTRAPPPVPIPPPPGRPGSNVPPLDGGLNGAGEGVSCSWNGSVAATPLT